QLRQACTTDADCGAGAPAGSCTACYPTFIRQKPSMATRYAYPASRCVSAGYPLPCCTGAGTGNCSGSSYLRWDKGLPQGTAGDPNNPRIAQSTAFRLHQDDAAVCCSGPSAAFCSGSPFPFSPYPVLWRPDCTAPRAVRTLINEDNIVPDWVFEA